MKLTSELKNLAITSTVVASVAGLGGAATYMLELTLLRLMKKKATGIGTMTMHAVRGFVVGMLVNIVLYLTTALTGAPYQVFVLHGIGGANQAGMNQICNADCNGAIGADDTTVYTKRCDNEDPDGGD